ncbi:hypothetical protein KEM56_002150, partial [Ascosphaera pollenicola]
LELPRLLAPDLPSLKKNWQGPEHWKIKKIRDANATTNTTAAAKTKRKEKESFEINFADDLDPAAAALIYTPAASNTAISMPKTQWKTKGRNLLPDDKHFNSRQLLRLFLKPRARMGYGSRRRANGASQLPNSTNIDENYWAQQKNPSDATQEQGAQSAYDANFFADDDGLAFPDGLPDDDDDNAPFADGAENLGPGDATVGGSSGLATLLNTGIPESQGFGSQLVTQGGRRIRPEYVAYAKTAKKVDVRKLKDTMWKGMGEKLPESRDYDSAAKDAAIAREEELDRQKENEALNPTASADGGEDKAQDDMDTSSLRFTSVMNDLKSSYNEPALKDISTSYCFICLLHLANEKGLVLSNKLENRGGVEGWTDGAGGLDEIFVARDKGAVIEEVEL